MQQWYREHGLTPRRKKSGGRVQSRRVLSYEDTTRVFQFITNFAEEHALILPGHVPCFKRSDLRLLPSTNSKPASGGTTTSQLWKQQVGLMLRNGSIQKTACFTKAIQINTSIQKQCVYL